MEKDTEEWNLNLKIRLESSFQKDIFSVPDKGIPVGIPMTYSAKGKLLKQTAFVWELH